MADEGSSWMFEIPNDDGVVRLRMQVDRRQLEYIMQGKKFFIDGEHIFRILARKHGVTDIVNDVSFKIGARTKRDPMIWVVGHVSIQPQMIAAKEDLLDLFDANANRVVVRCEIAKEQHFFVIGPKGEHVRRIMAATGCNIHFPEQEISSNQVTISGAPDGVEEARLRLRGLMPVTYSFEVPRSVSVESSFISSMAAEFSVQIYFKNRGIQGQLILIKGVRCLATMVEKCASKIWSTWTKMRELPSYTIQFDLPSSLHIQLMGPNNEYIKYLMAVTNTKIRFPDPGHLPAVFISGNDDGVKTAYMYIQSLLPVSLAMSLSVTETKLLSDSIRGAGVSAEEHLSEISRRFNIEVFVREKDDIATVTLTGYERNASMMYQARSAILLALGNHKDHGMGGIRTDLTSFELMIDEAAFLPDLPAVYAELFPDHAAARRMAAANLLAGTDSPAQSSGSGNSQHLQGLSTELIHRRQSAPNENPEQHRLALSSTEAFAVPHSQVLSMREIKAQEADKKIHASEISSIRKPTDSFSGYLLSASMPAAHFAKLHTEHGSPKSIRPPPGLEKREKSRKSSPTTSIIMEASDEAKAIDAAFVSPPRQSLHTDTTSTTANLLVSGEGNNSGAVLSTTIDMSTAPIASSIPASNDTVLPSTATTADANVVVIQPSVNVPIDNHHTTSAATTAVITATVNPLLLSASSSILGTSPVPIISPQASSSSLLSSAEKATPTKDIASSSPVKTTTPSVEDYWNVKSVSELLTKLSMDAYIARFEDEEIDLATILTMSEEDLSSLGVAKFGPRRRLKKAIDELQALRPSFLRAMVDQYHHK